VLGDVAGHGPSRPGIEASADCQEQRDACDGLARQDIHHRLARAKHLGLGIED
jgi:hypothetical protein